jgi:hypothetical protein
LQEYLLAVFKPTASNAQKTPSTQPKEGKNVHFGFTEKQLPK